MIPADFGPAFQQFIVKFPFTSAKRIVTHFLVTSLTIKEIMHQDLRMRRFKRKWLPNLLTEDQNKSRVNCSRSLLQILQNLVDHQFNGITTGDESWFSYVLDSPEMFAGSRDKVSPKVRQEIARKNYGHNFSHQEEFSFWTPCQNELNSFETTF
jgi:hypothetical protein